LRAAANSNSLQSTQNNITANSATLVQMGWTLDHTTISTQLVALIIKLLLPSLYEMFCKSLKKKNNNNIQDDSVNFLIRKLLHSLFCCICFVFKRICVSLASQAQNSAMRWQRQAE
jgi:hypothetical protein